MRPSRFTEEQTTFGLTEEPHHRISFRNAASEPQLHLSPPVNPPSGNTKSYTIIITIGSDRHVMEVAQAPIGA